MSANTSILATNLDFADFSLNSMLLSALHELGYQSPSPIQAEIIPHLLDGKDVIGQAQTGTGKTAAFALPILNNLELSVSNYSLAPKALVLAPTRELAIQVADSFRKYSINMRGLRVATICGGQDYKPQLNQLKNGVDIVVGTPGRIIDHIKRGSLDITEIKNFVLDEADEMLRMGFIEDIDWILEHVPHDKQIALFSATMPKAIQKIALKYLKNPIKVTIAPKKETSKLIQQSYLQVNFPEKIKTLIKILDIHKYDGINGVIIFVRTKMDTITVCEQLIASGHKAVALNGDIEQKQRERTLRDLKEGRIDILIATDVAARGLDVDRITHVINFDMPHDTETYMHRIGRTGRAGKSGYAISFVTRGEKGRLRDIERYTKQDIPKYQMPDIDKINKCRVEIFEAKILKILERSGFNPEVKEELDQIIEILSNLSERENKSGYEIAAAIVTLLHGKSPLLMSKDDLVINNNDDDDRSRRRQRSRDGRSNGSREGSRSRRRDGENRGRGKDRERSRDGDGRGRGNDRDRSRNKKSNGGFKSEGGKSRFNDRTSDNKFSNSTKKNKTKSVKKKSY